MSMWLVCLAYIHFDLSVGPVVEHVSPRDALTARGRSKVLQYAFPDTSAGVQQHDYIFPFIVRDAATMLLERDTAVTCSDDVDGSSGDGGSSVAGAAAAAAAAAAVASGCSSRVATPPLMSPTLPPWRLRKSNNNATTTSSGYHGVSSFSSSCSRGHSGGSLVLYGATYYRQKRDARVPRGYVQQAVVLLSRLPYFAIHELVLRVVASRFCRCCALSPDVARVPIASMFAPTPTALFVCVDDHYRGDAYTQTDVLDAAVRDVGAWPPPHPRTRYDVALLRQSLRFVTPAHTAPCIDARAAMAAAAAAAASAAMVTSAHVSVRPHVQQQQQTAEWWQWWQQQQQQQQQCSMPSSPRSLGSSSSSSNHNSSSSHQHNSASASGTSPPPPSSHVTRAAAACGNSSSISQVRCLDDHTSPYSDSYDNKLYDMLPLYGLLGDHLHHLTYCWELLMAHEPLLLLGTSPVTAAASAMALTSLVLPVHFRGVLLPYFTVQNDDYHRLRRLGHALSFAPHESVVVAATNPFLLRQFDGWPHVLVVTERHTHATCSRYTCHAATTTTTTTTTAHGEVIDGDDDTKHARNGHTSSAAATRRHDKNNNSNGSSTRSGSRQGGHARFYSCNGASEAMATPVTTSLYTTPPPTTTTTTSATNVTLQTQPPRRSASERVCSYATTTTTCVTPAAASDALVTPLSHELTHHDHEYDCDDRHHTSTSTSRTAASVPAVDATSASCSDASAPGSFCCRDDHRHRHDDGSGGSGDASCMRAARRSSSCAAAMVSTLRFSDTAAQHTHDSHHATAALDDAAAMLRLLPSSQALVEVTTADVATTTTTAAAAVAASATTLATTTTTAASSIVSVQALPCSAHTRLAFSATSSPTSLRGALRAARNESSSSDSDDTSDKTTAATSSSSSANAAAAAVDASASVAGGNATARYLDATALLCDAARAHERMSHAVIDANNNNSDDDGDDIDVAPLFTAREYDAAVASARVALPAGTAPTSPTTNTRTRLQTRLRNYFGSSYVFLLDHKELTQQLLRRLHAVAQLGVDAQRTSVSLSVHQWCGHNDNNDKKKSRSAWLSVRAPHGDAHATHDTHARNGHTRTSSVQPPQQAATAMATAVTAASSPSSSLLLHHDHDDDNNDGNVCHHDGKQAPRSASSSRTSSSSTCSRADDAMGTGTAVSTAALLAQCTVADDVVRKFFASLTMEFLRPVTAWFASVVAATTSSSNSNNNNNNNNSGSAPCVSSTSARGSFCLCDRATAEELLQPRAFLAYLRQHHRRIAPAMLTRQHHYSTYKTTYERFAHGSLFAAFTAQLVEHRLRSALDTFDVEQWMAVCATPHARIHDLMCLYKYVQCEVQQSLDVDVLFLSTVTSVLASMAASLDAPYNAHFMLKISELHR